MNDINEIQCQLFARCLYPAAAAGSTAQQQALNAYSEAFTNFDLLSELSLKQCPIGNQRQNSFAIERVKPSHTRVY